MVRAVIEGWAGRGGRTLASGMQRIAGLGSGVEGELGRCAGREQAHSSGVGVVEGQLCCWSVARDICLLSFIHSIGIAGTCACMAHGPPVTL